MLLDEDQADDGKQALELFWQRRSLFSVPPQLWLNPGLLALYPPLPTLSLPVLACSPWTPGSSCGFNVCLRDRDGEKGKEINVRICACVPNRTFSPFTEVKVHVYGCSMCTWERARAGVRDITQQSMHVRLHEILYVDASGTLILYA